MRPGTQHAVAWDPWAYARDQAPRSFVAAPWLSQGHPPHAPGLGAATGRPARTGTINNGYDVGSIVNGINPALAYDELARAAAERSLAPRGPQRVFTPPRRF